MFARSSWGSFCIHGVLFLEVNGSQGSPWYCFHAFKEDVLSISNRLSGFRLKGAQVFVENWMSVQFFASRKNVKPVSRTPKKTNVLDKRMP